jgi:hypothetical protein
VSITSVAATPVATRSYPHHLFDLPEDIAYFHCADLSPLLRDTTHLTTTSVYVSLRGCP